MAGAVRNSLQANPTCLLSRPCRIAKHLTIFFVSCQRSPHPGSPIRLLSPEHSQMIAINSPKPFSAVSAAAAAAALWPSLRRKPVAPPLEAAYSSMEWLDASPHDDFHLVVCLQKAAFARENATKKKLSFEANRAERLNFTLKCMERSIHLQNLKQVQQKRQVQQLERLRRADRVRNEE